MKHITTFAHLESWQVQWAEQSAMLKFESFLIKNSVISGTFEELNNSKFMKTQNHKRLPMIAFNVLIAMRWSVILTPNRQEWLNTLGDVLWAYGLTGYFISFVSFVMALVTIWYLSILSYCEYRGQLGFLNELTMATQIKSKYTNALAVNTGHIFSALEVNIVVAPYFFAAGMFLLSTLKAYQINRSISLMVYSTFWNIVLVVWVKYLLVHVYSVSALVYLSASLINQHLS